MENQIKVHLPIGVTYPALEEVLKKKMVGEYIPKLEEGVKASPYAQILDVGVVGSSSGTYNIILRVKIRVLRTVLKRDQVELYVQAKLTYDNTAQQLFVQRFNMEAKTTSGFYNTALEVLVNKVAYNQIIQKSRLNIKEILATELKKANTMLEKGLELKGLKLTGAVEGVLVQDVLPQPEKVTLILEAQANLEVNISELISLMPTK
ncbi:DUF4403 family protein [Pontibacter harenae]|uniref:DUF4403 family protein n=1 Tax=Pontibacter harenae TaxID=2894083 RepID=UPI001E35AD68|nr:DUF4403 family protein [Pontibacter harenae]MCC9165798.1 DUF4403 family protein [Pontibacter harenae]